MLILDLDWKCLSKAIESYSWSLLKDILINNRQPGGLFPKTMGINECINKQIVVNVARISFLGFLGFSYTSIPYKY